VLQRPLCPANRRSDRPSAPVNSNEESFSPRAKPELYQNGVSVLERSGRNGDLELSDRRLPIIHAKRLPQPLCGAACFGRPRRRPGKAAVAHADAHACRCRKPVTAYRPTSATPARKEVTRRPTGRLCLPKTLSGMTVGWSCAAWCRQITRDGGLGNGVPQHEKLTVDPWSTPEKVLPGHLSDQIAHLTGDPRTPTSPTTRGTISPER
jgi:hypothetical protein